MKKLLSLLLLILPITLAAQLSDTNPDTVCYQNTINSTYVTDLVAGYTYTWSVSAPGVITSGQGTETITVDWSTATPGLISGAVSVFATSAEGCVGPPIIMDVFVLQVVPTATPLTFCEDDPCAPLIGTPLGGTWTGSPYINGDQFCPTDPGTYQVTYTYNIPGCGPVAVNTTITVNPTPILNEITHD